MILESWGPGLTVPTGCCCAGRSQQHDEILTTPTDKQDGILITSTDTHDILKILTSTDQKTGHLGHPINISETIQSEGINQSRQCQMRKTK